MKIGDDVLIRMADDLDTAAFGSGWRIGHLVAVGRDILYGEPVLELDDGGPRIYAAHIDYLTVLTPAPAPASASRDVYGG